MCYKKGSVGSLLQIEKFYLPSEQVDVETRGEGKEPQERHLRKAVTLARRETPKVIFFL